MIVTLLESVLFVVYNVVVSGANLSISKLNRSGFGHALRPGVSQAAMEQNSAPQRFDCVAGCEKHDNIWQGLGRDYCSRREIALFTFCHAVHTQECIGAISCAAVATMDLEFVSSACNKVPNCLAWGACGTVVFGAGAHVALYNTKVRYFRFVSLVNLDLGTQSYIDSRWS